MTRVGPPDLSRLLRRGAARTVNGVRYALGENFTLAQPTPRDLVWRQGKVELWRYRNDQVVHHPPILLVFGLFSKSYLFDLYDRVSLVRTLRDAGFDVFLLNWGEADAGDADNTLETYVSRLIPRAVQALLRTSGASSCTLAGYCMGGNLVLLTAATRPELPIANVVIMATAIDWDQMQPQIDPLRRPEVTPNWFTDDSGCIPGEVLAQFFRIRRPAFDAAQALSLWANLENSDYVAGHQAVTRWTRDHVPMPRGVAQQVLDQWLRRNGFFTNRLTLHGRAVDLRSVTMPLLAILTRRDEVVPPAAARPLTEVVGSPDREVVELDAGHLGLVVGRSAHKELHPKLIDWLVRHGKPAPTATEA